MKKAAIVIPTYNEAGDIEKVIDQIFSEAKKIENWELHVLVVDSTSQDNTDSIVKGLQKKYPRLHLLETKKEGLGKAYIHGFTYVLEKLNPYLIFEMDADLSHDPKEIPQFLKSIESGSDFVIGARYIKGGSIPKEWALHRKLFSILGNLVIRFGFFNMKITDWTDGYRAIKAWIIKDSLEYVNQYSGYIFQIALLDNAIKQNAVVKEIPINFKDRSHGVSKINSAQYIAHILFYVFSHSSFVKFVIVGLIGFILDFSISYVLIEKMHKALWYATIISTESAIICNFFLNNFWSFSHKRIAGGTRSYMASFLKFNLVSSGSVAIQTIGIHIFDLIFGRKWWYIYKVLLIVFVVIPYSYFFYNKLIWKNKK